jgi:protein TonB
MKSGHHYEFKEIYQRPVFNYGQVTFDYFINKNLKYPESARKYKMTGYVMIEFYVEQNGMQSDVKVSQGLIKSLDDEAVRVVSLSPLWYPATKYGILLRTRQTVFINFYDAYYRHTN